MNADDGAPDWATQYETADPLRELERDPYVNAVRLAGRMIPPREWHVPELIPAGTVTLLSGDGGTGKSLLAMQLAAATATGRHWIGRETLEGSALYLSAEDDMDELHRRFADVLRAEGLTFADAGRLTLRSLAGEDALLATLDRSGGLAPTLLLRDVEDRLASDRARLLVLDTLADLFPGNENDRAQARAFVGLIRGIAIRRRCAVLMLSHPSVAGMASGTGSSGSTAWNNSVRSRLYFERVVSEGYEPDPDARRLVLKKSNYARTGNEFGLHWRDGVFAVDVAETGLDRRAASAKAERVFLKLLALFAEQGRRVNHAGGQTYAPTVFASHPQAEGVSKRAFASAMEKLMAEGSVRIAVEGPPSKRRQHLETGEA